MKQLWLLISMLALVLACAHNQGVEEPTPHPPLFYIPKNFPQPVYQIDKNPVTQAGFELGRTLFYDGLLSRDGSMPCGECHQQNFSFTHHLHDLSHGIDDQIGLRNAQALHNLAWERSFSWDGGVFDLDLFPVVPIENPVEMDEKLGNVLTKLRNTNKYPPLFRKAFGSDEITSERFLKALSQFMVSLVSANSRYDKYIRNEGATLSTAELAGFELFKQKCANCHEGELFTDGSFRNNGLPYRERIQLSYRVENGKKIPFFEKVIDEGRYRVTELDTDRNKFKVPSLRNIEATKPYMHDGRFQTLQEVLDHYATGVSDTQNLDPILKQNGKLGITLTADEKSKIIAFLRTLTDTEFLNNPRFAAQ